MDGGKRPDRGDNRDDDKGKRKATRRDGAPTRRLNLDSDEEEETVEVEVWLLTEVEAEVYFLLRLGVLDQVVLIL